MTNTCNLDDFNLPYGKSKEELAEELDITVEELNSRVEEYFQQQSNNPFALMVE